jgi:glycine cleavage system T protein
MLRRSKLFEIQEKQGAQFTEYRGWEVPERFASIDEEYDWVKSSAGLIDLSSSGVIEARGPDRAQFLHRMVTNDINALTPGEGCYATFLTPQGRTLADMRVYCLEDVLLMTVEPDLREKVVTGLRKFMIGNRVELLDRSEELALLSVQGPKSGGFLSQVTPSVSLSPRPFDHSMADIGTGHVRCCRVNRTAPGGYDLLVPQQNLTEIWNLLSERGKPLAIRPVGLNAMNVHRVEAGIPLYGADIDETQIPLEAGLDNAISLKKGCYIGQEIIARATYLGHLNRKLAGLLLTGDQAVTKGDRVFREEKEIGWITSSVYSPGLRRPIALGYLRREVLTPGTNLMIDHETARIRCEVTTLPFVTYSTQESR